MRNSSWVTSIIASAYRCKEWVQSLEEELLLKDCFGAICNILGWRDTFRGKAVVDKRWLWKIDTQGFNVGYIIGIGIECYRVGLIRCSTHFLFRKIDFFLGALITSPGDA